MKVGTHLQLTRNIDSSEREVLQIKICSYAPTLPTTDDRHEESNTHDIYTGPHDSKTVKQNKISIKRHS